MSSQSDQHLQCFCGRTYSQTIDLQEHRRARGHFPSHVCSYLCAIHSDAQGSIGHYECKGCGKICERLDILKDHRIATGHCYCSDCDLPFESQSALKHHRETKAHASEYRCCDCNILFKDIHALNNHKHKSPKKAAKTVSATAKVHGCNKCQRVFPTPQALESHRASIKHKPLSNLSCPVGDRCRGKFTSPSALLHHLESGKCTSGINREEIYSMVESCDQEFVIHSLPELPPSSSSTSVAYTPSSDSDLSLVSFDTQSQWSFLTPTPSLGSVEDSLEQWSFLEGSQVSLESRSSINVPVIPNLRCPICPKERKKFASVLAFEQHMNSPVHCAKVYHCPTKLFLNQQGKTGTKGRKERHFSTLSGLAQHMESGACGGGKKAFFSCVDLIQRHLEQLGFGGMRLLLPKSRG